jgi:hypothetical protein
VRLQVKAVELEVDVRLQPAEFAGEAGVAGEPDPVRIQHHDTDPLRLGERHEATAGSDGFRASSA